MKKLIFSFFALMITSISFGYINYYDYQTPAQKWSQDYLNNLNLPKKNEIYMQDNRGNNGTLTWYETTGPLSNYIDKFAPRANEGFYKGNNGYSATFRW